MGDEEGGRGTSGRASHGAAATAVASVRSTAASPVVSTQKNISVAALFLNNFCKLLGLDAFLHCFQLLKSREKLHRPDKICQELRGGGVHQEHLGAARSGYQQTEDDRGDAEAGVE